MTAQRRPPDLDFLAELAQAFARAYPALAPHLAESSSDPDVERLLDAFSYLTEHVGSLIDESAGTTTQFFGDLLTPELSRSFPSATIVEFAPPAHGRRVCVPSGAEAISGSVDGASCRFGAWSSLDVVPWTVADACIERRVEHGSSLTLTLEAQGDDASSFPGSLLPLRVHCAGNPHTASTLLFLVHCHLIDITLYEDGMREAPIGSDLRLRPWGFRADEALLPPEPWEHPGLRLLREYLLMPAKFAFFEVHPPPLVAEQTSRQRTLATPPKRVALRFRFNANVPAQLEVTRADIRVNCVPMVNVFETTAEPICPSLERPTHLLRPSGLEDGEVYSVKQVLARVVGRPGVVPVSPVSDFRATPPGALREVSYVTQVATAATDGSTVPEVRLTLTTPVDGAPVPEIEFMSVEILASNGVAPNALRIGDLRVPGGACPDGLQLRNIRATTSYCAPAHGDALRWRTLAMTTLSALSLTSVDALRTLLTILDLRAISDMQAARAHAQRSSAIAGIAVTTAHLHEGLQRGDASAGFLGHDVAISLNLAGFESEGEAWVFASVLAHLYGHEASIGRFVRTTARIVETGRTFAFPPLHGDRNLEHARER